MRSSFGDHEAETLDVLAGRRNAASRPAAAVRIEDLGGLLDIETDLQSKAVTAPPTAEDFNRLLQDCRRIHDCLRTVVQALQERLTR